MPMTTAQRLDLLREVYNVVAGSVESFEHDDEVGPDLAYLLGAILNGTACTWPEGRAIVAILRVHFTDTSPVHGFVLIEKDEAGTPTERP